MNAEKPTPQKDTDPSSDPAFEPGTYEFANRKRAEMEPRLAGEVVEVTSGMITVPESVQAALDAQKVAEAATAPAPQPPIETPDWLMTEGSETLLTPDEAGRQIKENFQPGLPAIRRHGIEVEPGKFVMPNDLEAYNTDKDKE